MPCRLWDVRAFVDAVLVGLGGALRVLDQHLAGTFLHRDLFDLGELEGNWSPLRWSLNVHLLHELRVQLLLVLCLDQRDGDHRMTARRFLEGGGSSTDMSGS